MTNFYGCHAEKKNASFTIKYQSLYQDMPVLVIDTLWKMKTSNVQEQWNIDKSNMNILKDAVEKYSLTIPDVEKTRRNMQLNMMLPYN